MKLGNKITKVLMISLVVVLVVSLAVVPACKAEEEEVAELRQQIAQLEAEIERLEAEIEELTAPPDGTAEFPPAGTYEWNMFMPHSGTGPIYLSLFLEFTQEVEEATQGALSIDILGAGEHPFAWNEMLKALKDGYCEIICYEPAYEEGNEPLGAITGLPLLLPIDYEKAASVDEALMDTVYKPIVDRWNGQILYSTYHESSSLFCKSTFVENWDSVKGKQLRSWSPSCGELWTLLGATPVSMSPTEISTGLATGLIEGAPSDCSYAMSLGLYDYCKAVTLMGIDLAPIFFVVNNDALAELDDATRSVLLEKAAKYQELSREATIETQQQIIMTAILDYGVVVKRMPPDFREEVRSAAEEAIWIPWAEAVPGALEALEIVKRVLAE